MKECNPVSTPTECGINLTQNDRGKKKIKIKKINATFYKQIVESLMYLTSTRPNIMHGISLISRYMENPTENHLLAAKMIFRYLKGTFWLWNSVYSRNKGKFVLVFLTVIILEILMIEKLHWVCFYDEFWSCVMVIKETINCNFINNRRWICCRASSSSSWRLLETLQNQ